MASDKNHFYIAKINKKCYEYCNIFYFVNTLFVTNIKLFVLLRLTLHINLLLCKHNLIRMMSFQILLKITS